ncbi:GIY-YIG nuclease family protein [Stappia albiluteola]|uniref:GIY-YIG nuclease family protein n=1 Tax=Stappia albiluteola TaxID=2758565 RepID=UPI0038B51BA1
MPQHRKPPRLLLRNEKTGKTWIIRDNGRSFRTGFSEGEIDLAEERLAQYVAGEYTPSNTKIAYVYYVTAAHSVDYPIKIGFTAGAMSIRLTQFQLGNPNVLVCLATEIGSQALERDRHARFRHLHIRGEWFRRDPSLMGFIESIQPTEIYK